MKPQRALDPSLPQNIEAERSVLGAVLLDNKALNAASEKIIPTDLFHDHHRKIYTSMLEMQNEEKPIDLVTLTDWMAAKRELEAVGGAAYISTLMDGVPNVTNIGHYADIIKEKARLRGIISAAEFAQRQAFDPGADPGAIEDSWQKGFAGKANGNGHTNGNGHGPKFHSYSLMEFMQAHFPPKEHLIESIVPRSTPGMVIALPHRLKSWFTTGIALGATNAGLLMGKLSVERPVRTYLAQLEDWPGELQSRLGNLLRTAQFMNCTHENVRILPRCDLDLTQKESFDFMVKELCDFKPDLVILDVLRKFFSGDVNSPKETRSFLNRVDELADISQSSIFLVHHENRKKEEIMLAAAGSYNFPGWAQVMIHFSRKNETRTPEGMIASVEIEVDNKVSPPVNPFRLTLNLNSAMPLLLEALEDGTGFTDAMGQLENDGYDGWDVTNLADVLSVHRTSAQRRIVKWLEQGKVEKFKTGKRGNGKRLAMYRRTNLEESSVPE